MSHLTPKTEKGYSKFGLERLVVGREWRSLDLTPATYLTAIKKLREKWSQQGSGRSGVFDREEGPLGA